MVNRIYLFLSFDFVFAIISSCFCLREAWFSFAMSFLPSAEKVFKLKIATSINIILKNNSSFLIKFINLTQS